jgi:hypothetical protein
LSDDCAICAKHRDTSGALFAGAAAAVVAFAERLRG